jgi:membrane-bound metal-dependent hydrolase YbcI (DUF457 family)
MFVGHLALAFAGKRFDARPSLGWYIAAVTALDLLWPIFLLVGIEHVSVAPGATAFTPLVFDSYPWSHSLLMSVCWGAALAGVARWRGLAPSSALLLALLVVSHWLLDYFTHAPDLPLWPGASPRAGVGLWNSIGGTIAVEGGLWLAGIWLYLGPRRSTRWVGPAALWSLIFISTVMWLAGPWSPPPPSERAIGWFALIGWIIIPWAALADRYYQLRH